MERCHKAGQSILSFVLATWILGEVAIAIVVACYGTGDYLATAWLTQATLFLLALCAYGGSRLALFALAGWMLYWHSWMRVVFMTVLVKGIAGYLFAGYYVYCLVSGVVLLLSANVWHFQKYQRDRSLAAQAAAADR